MGLILRGYQSRTFIPYFVLFTSWTIACSQQVDPVLQNRNRGQELESISGTPLSMPEALPWFSILKPRESPPSIMSFLMRVLQLSLTWSKVRFHPIGKSSLVSPASPPGMNLWIWLSSGCWDKKSMLMRMGILFLFRIGSPTLSVSCLISTVLSRITYAQKLTIKLALPLVQLPRESANAHRLLSQLARPLQLGPCR